MPPIIERNIAYQNVLMKHFFSVQENFSEEHLQRFGSFFSEGILQRYLSALSTSNFANYVQQHTFPEFEEEIYVPFIEIWQIHHHFLEDLVFLRDQIGDNLLKNFLLERPFNEFLIILGQRITPASIQNSEGIPPNSSELIHQAFIPYNREIKTAVRAWEKHVGRNETDFWGSIAGTPDEKEKHVIQLVEAIISEHYWWNIFEHFKHGKVYEIRAKSGHGLRWSITKREFIGFVEPF